MFIVVEIPLQLRPHAYTISDEAELVEIANNLLNGFYSVISLEMALEWNEEKDEGKEIFNSEVWSILRQEKQVVEVIYDECGNRIEYYRLSEAPTEFEAACEALGHDMQSFNVLTVKEAREWTEEYPSGYSGHQWVETKIAIKEELEKIY